MSRHAHHGYIDAIQNGCITGWAAAPADAGNPASLFLFIDDELADNFSCDIDRPDLEPLGLSGKRAGFKTRVPERFLDGAPHTICIRSNGGEYLLVADQNGGFTHAATVSLRPGTELTSYVDGLSNGAIRGWAVTQERNGPKRGACTILARCGGIEVGRFTADKYRADVSQAIGCDPNCGFMFVPPLRYRDGRPHLFELSLAETGESLANSPVAIQYPDYIPETKLAQLYSAVEAMSTQLFQLRRELKGMASRTALTLEDYDGWARQYRQTLHHCRRRTEWPAARPRPLVSVICPVFRPDPAHFTAAIDSVLAQTYRNLELILVDDHSDQAELTALIKAYAARDPRTRAHVQPKNTGISRATNAALAIARGTYIAFCDHDDLLDECALEIMVEAALLSQGKLLYSDEDKIDEFGRHSEPNLKSAWNYRLLLAQNYICHLILVEAETLRAAGPLRKKYDGAQDHDLILRLAEQLSPAQIVHVPEILYHWRKSQNSTAAAIAAKSYAPRAGAQAVRDHLARRGLDTKALPPLGAASPNLAWNFGAEPTVTIIIPFRDQVEMTRRCLDAILTHTQYGAVRICLVDNWSITEGAKAFCTEIAARGAAILRIEQPFNYAKLNNIACAQTQSEFIVFMNNDVVVQQPDWLRRLVDEALADPDVAAVGAKLLYPDRIVQHGGVILGVGGVGDHAHRGRTATAPGYIGRSIFAQELSAVTAALMLCRTAAFHAVGGFDEQELAVAYNDVDLCLKLRASGYKVIYCPAVAAEHHESASRGDDLSGERLGRFVYEEQVMLSRWGDAIKDDPFYNPNFSHEGGIFEQLSTEPLETVAHKLPRLRAGGTRPQPRNLTPRTLTPHIHDKTAQ